jgi:hypothetical protein
MADFRPIASIPLSDDLSDIQKVEFRALQEAMTEIESEAIRLRKGDNVDQQSAIALLKEMREKQRSQADERQRLRVEVIAEQVERERRRIESEFEEAKSALGKRIVRAYCQADQYLTSQLKDLMGKDFSAYLQANPIDFPPMPPDTQMKTRLQQPEEAKIRLSTPDAERDLKKIQQKFRETRDLR